MRLLAESLRGQDLASDASRTTLVRTITVYGDYEGITVRDPQGQVVNETGAGWEIR